MPTARVALNVLCKSSGDPMKRQIPLTFAVCIALTSAVFAQNYQRQAAMVGGGGPDGGKCTIEVVVDNVAQVEIRGASATLVNVSGQPPQWRRFECTAAMPANPQNFNFAGVDGRGQQSLVREPRNGGVAVVQIEDKDNGSEGYTFDITWGSRGYNNDRNPQYAPNAGPARVNAPDYRDNSQHQDRSGDQPRQNYRENYRDNYQSSGYYRQYGHGFGANEAVRICQQDVARQATQRFRVTDIHFERTTVDNNPGREDWVTGSLDIHRRGRGETYAFSCSVDFDSGRVRTAQLDPRPLRPDGR